MYENSRKITPDVQEIAIAALSFLASRPDDLGRFLSLTGASVADLRTVAGEPETLGAVLDHVLSHEALLLDFCQQEALSPERVNRARASLPGAPVWD